MGKILITKNNVSDFVQDESKEIFIKKNMILSSGAMDILRNRGIAIYYGDERPVRCGASCEVKDLRCDIEKILRNEFDINYEKSLKQIMELVLKKYKDE